MPVPSQGHYGFHSFPVVDWFCLFIYLWVLTFPCKIVRSSIFLLLPLFNFREPVTPSPMRRLRDEDSSSIRSCKYTLWSALQQVSDLRIRYCWRRVFTIWSTIYNGQRGYHVCYGNRTSLPSPERHHQKNQSFSRLPYCHQLKRSMTSPFTVFLMEWLTTLPWVLNPSLLPPKRLRQ